MDDEQSAKLSQDMFDAKDDAARIRVAIHWLPVLIRCLMKTAGRVKLMLARLEALEQKVDAQHAPKQVKEEDKTKETDHAPQTRLALALKFFKENWQSVVLFLLFLKAFGLEGLLKDLFTLAR